MSTTIRKVRVRARDSHDNFRANGFEIDGVVIRSSSDLGDVIREQRKRQLFLQLDIADLGNTGNRFIVELERGKPTVQLQKVLDVVDLLGLELVVRPKTIQS